MLRISSSPELNCWQLRLSGGKHKFIYKIGLILFDVLSSDSYEKFYFIFIFLLYTSSYCISEQQKICLPMRIAGISFRILGYYTGQPLLGAKVVAAMLMFATVSGILMALFLNTAGGAWDNAKKYIETGALGGKGSDAHKAAITGDT